MLTVTQVDDQSAAGFFEEAQPTMLGLAHALNDVIASVPGDTRRPVDVERTLGLDASLAWQVCRIAHAADPLRAGIHVPGAAAMKRFLRSAGERGAEPRALDDLRAAYGGFEELIARHCGDRASFDTMVDDGSDSERLTLKYKRAAYRAHKHLWGVHTATAIKCVMLHLTDDGYVDIADVRVHAGIRRLRANVPYVLKVSFWETISHHDGTGTEFVVTTRAPIDKRTANEHGLGLVPEFCSRPLPDIRARQGSSGVLRAEIVGQSVGNNSVSTCTVGEISRNATAWPMPRDEGEDGDDCLVARLWVTTPTEVALNDLLVPIGWSDRSTPDVAVYGRQVGPEELEDSLEFDRLWLAEEGYYAGAGPSAVRTPEYPEYPRLVEHVCELLGWDPQSFDVYRSRIAYPILNSVVAMTVQTPTGDGSG